MEEDERRRLQQLLERQAEEARGHRQEICILSRKGGHVLPPNLAPLPPLPSVPAMARLSRINPHLRQGGGRPSTSSQGVE